MVCMKILLVALYMVVLLPMRLAALVLGRDPLQIRRPAGRTTHWVAKDPDQGVESYFSQHAARPLPARRIIPFYLLLAKLGGRKHQAGPAGARPAEIPDEIYTLW